MPYRLTKYERETIIIFNEADEMASIYTHSRSWQRHLEKKFGLKPTMDNGYGGKEYEIDKKQIKPPRAPRNLSPEDKAKIAQRLLSNRKRVHS